ncbi:hypothetical protein FOA43_000291 [Brettanomyces nanus]|uniref:Serine/threonine-protein kinase MEC1 n=1 Tax=Eeniella nana TaxID=13502 RepID=A0A875RSY5_EENNA|nr:uncharacterized protein FOA43_000291 [Brettanomyces nanus]QPG72987.1 hypothetical protein FOA43_000291 [Brettanomyces nanus]
MAEQIKQLSEVLDALLKQKSSGKEQDSNSLNALLDTVLPSYLGRSLSQEEVHVVLKIFQALRLLLSRSPSLIIENEIYKKLLKYIKVFYDSIQYPKELSDSANLTLVQVISAAFTGGKLRNNKYLLAIRNDLIETLEVNLKQLLRSILSTSNNNDNTSSKGVIMYANEIASENDRKFSKLSVSIRILQVLLNPTLRNIFMLHLQCSMLLDNFIRRTWFCMNNIVINLDLKREEGEGVTGDSDLGVAYLSQTSVPSIAYKFDQLFAVLLNSTVGYFNDDDDCQMNILDLALSQCKQLLNWALIAKFPSLQVVLAESLMKLLLKCRELGTCVYFWNKTDLCFDKRIFIVGYMNGDLHQDLYITINLLLVLNASSKGITARESSMVIVDRAIKPYVNRMLDSIRERLLRSFASDDVSMNLDFLLRLTDGKSLLYLNHSYSQMSLLQIVKGDPTSGYSARQTLAKWLHSLESLLNTSPDSILGSSIGKHYLINSLGRFACILNDDFDFTRKCCERCDSCLDERHYNPDLVDVNRPSYKDDSIMYSAYKILEDRFMVEKPLLDDEQLVLSLLISLGRIFRTYRPPPLSKGTVLWSFIQKCFVSVVREIRMMTVRLLPLILYCPEGAQYHSDLDHILGFLSSFAPSRSTSYIFEGIIVSWGELLCISKLDSKYFVLLNPLIQFMGDNDEFRSNLALHEIRIVASTRRVTPWKLVEPFIPVISCDLLTKQITNPGLLLNFCECIEMNVSAFLNRTQDYTIPRLIQYFDSDPIGFIAKQLEQSKTRLVSANLCKCSALLLVSEDVISPAKITKILSIFIPRYKKASLQLILRELNVLELIWELMSLYNCTPELLKRIRNAIVCVCVARRASDIPINGEQEESSLLDDQMKLTVLGLAQDFSDIIHNNKGSKPFIEKVQAIRAIWCLTELSPRFDACLSQIMTCLQLALESFELQYEGLECLRVIVSRLKYLQLSIIVDLLISYLIQKYTDFNMKCRSIAKAILKDIFQKDPRIIKEHPSYVYSLASSNTDLSEIVTCNFWTRNILVEFSRRLRADNKWVVSLVLRDLLTFFDIRQIDVQKTYISDVVLVGPLSSLISALLGASNRFSVTCTDIPKKCSLVLSMIGALDPSKFGSFFHRHTKNLVLVTNLTKEREIEEFSIYFLNNILMKCFIASSDPQKQLYLAYTMQQYLKILKLTDEKIKERGSKENIFWSKLSNLSQTVLKPLLVSRYTKNMSTHKLLMYPTYKETKKHSKWLTDFTEDLTFRAATAERMPRMARQIFESCTVIIRDQDLSICEFLLPYLALLLVVYGENDTYANIEIEITTVLTQDIEDLASDFAVESLKSCYRTVFSIIDYFREWISERKRDRKHLRSTSAVKEREIVEQFLADLPTEILAKRTAQCNSYERAIFNLEQSYQTEKMSENEFFNTIRHMYAELNDMDALQGVLKKFSANSLNDKLMQFQYSEDWEVTHESLAAIAEAEYPNIGGTLVSADREALRRQDKSVRITSLLKCLDDHCQYDQVLLELGRYQSLTLGSHWIDSKDMFLCGLQASIFTGELNQLCKWVRLSEQSTSITSPGSELSIYYEFAQALIRLHENDISCCLDHAERASSYVGLALSVSKEISHTKIADYMVLLHCLYDFSLLAKLKSGPSLETSFKLLRYRQGNTMKDFRTRWKIQSLKKAIVKLHPIEEVRQQLSSTLVESSQLLREYGRLDLATKNITHALTLGTDNSFVNFEFAQLLWAQGGHRQALKTLKSVIDSEKIKSPEMALQYTQWLENSANGSSDEIIKGYRSVAQDNKNLEFCGKAQYYLGRYYNKLLDAQEIETPGLKRLEKDFYGDLEFNVIKAYMRSASFSTEYLFEVLPKAVTIWLDYSTKYRDSKLLRSYSSEIIMAKRNDNYSGILKFITMCINDGETYKWYTVLSQLISRMIHGDKDTETLILHIITQMAMKYPQVILYSVYSQVQSDSSERRKRGQKICASLQNARDEVLVNQVQSAFELLEALKGICQARTSKEGKVKLWEDLKFSFRRGSECLSLALPIRANFDRLHSPVLTTKSKSTKHHNIDNFITFSKFEPEVSILSSMQKPRKIYVIGSDNKRYSILCKPNDDLRKDSKLMEFATVMDRLLQTDIESEKRSLSITSYAVVPLNENMGLIEMVDNVRTIRDIMLMYLQWQGNRFDYAKMKTLMGDPALSLSEKLHNYEKLKTYYRPVLQLWFADKFPNPVNWYEARNRYTRSCAVMSIVGYLLGMGDRHGDNILLNEITGQILHVDFDCLFDKGKKLQVPERVPFRLTQNMVAAMGVNGYEGTFRKACEVTMRLIRQNENILMNILETFLYDPILDWKKTSKKRRGVDHNPDSSSKLQPQVALNTIRRKIKGILDPRDLDTGAKDSGGLSVSVNAQVDGVIQQATSDENLAQMYIGWMAFL